MPNSTPKLPLTSEERAKLKACKIKLKDISSMDLSILSQCLEVTMERAKYLRALAIFQTVPSIGPKVAQRVVDLGYNSLSEIKNMKGSELFNRWEEKCEYWEDPCLEDAFRCIVYYANDPESDKSWFDFTEERKNDRKQYGYPDTRPKLAWYEVKN
ncbi:helix-hairpin-helix domain-containing protein [Rummeliibacillus sp. JY-2-4R]